jgi:GNAT superfamily N-acetyltransferase
VQLDPERLRLGVEAVLRDPARGFYTVAEAESRLVGQMMITYEWSDWRNGTFWWIQSVYVPPEYRKRGVYRRLYEHVLGQAKARTEVCGIRLYVDRHNRAAQQVYERLGMRAASYAMYELDFVLERAR